MSEKKQYVVPDEVMDMFAEATGMDNLVYRYVRLPFCFKKAQKCAVLVEKFRTKAWNCVYVLYPELKNKKITYRYGAVTIDEKAGV